MALTGSSQVRTWDEALADTGAAFDAVAHQYHRENVDNPVLAAMRARVIAEVMRCVPPESRILDLGCGPGTDAETLGRAGYHVTAIDWSTEMATEAAKRIRSAGLSERVIVRHLGIQDLDALVPSTFDAALSNFGPFNCVPDLARAASGIVRCLKPRGLVIASVIGRICPWEIAIHLRRGDVARARVRWIKNVVPVSLNGGRIWTRYYSPSEYERAFVAAGVTRVSLRTLGLLIPPPYADAFAGRHPGVFNGLLAVEDVVGGWPVLRSMGDHFLSVMRRD